MELLVTFRMVVLYQLYVKNNMGSMLKMNVGFHTPCPEVIIFAGLE